MIVRRLRGVAGEVERELCVTAEGAVEIAGEAYRVESAGAGVWRVTSGARSEAVHVARDADGLWVHADGRVHRVEITRAGAVPRRRVRAQDAVLTAPMPGTVLSILAEVGQAVKAGDTVLMLEAMKMELPVRAPHDGTVTAVHCREGEMVQPGVVLVDIT